MAKRDNYLFEGEKVVPIIITGAPDTMDVPATQKLINEVIEIRRKGGWEFLGATQNLEWRISTVGTALGYSTIQLSFKKEKASLKDAT